MRLLDKIPLSLLIIASLTLGLAPFSPPHLFEKVQMLLSGDLIKPIDIFDFVLHGFPVVLLFAKVIRMSLTKRRKML